MFAWLAALAFGLAIIFYFVAGKLAGDVEITALFGFLCVALHLTGLWAVGAPGWTVRRQPPA
jgi:hypothetical protein